MPSRYPYCQCAFIKHDLLLRLTTEQCLFLKDSSRLILALQVLQTLYILIQNLRSKTALYYICSNNHVNDLVTLSFDFEDEEVLGYYINLLKSISLQLTTKTAQFFFMVRSHDSELPAYLLSPLSTMEEK